VSESRRAASFLLVFSAILAWYFHVYGTIDWSAVGIAAVVGFVGSLTIGEFFGWIFAAMAAAGCFWLWGEGIAQFFNSIL